MLLFFKILLNFFIKKIQQCLPQFDKYGGFIYSNIIFLNFGKMLFSIKMFVISLGKNVIQVLKFFSLFFFFIKVVKFFRLFDSFFYNKININVNVTKEKNGFFFKNNFKNSNIPTVFDYLQQNNYLLKLWYFVLRININFKDLIRIQRNVNLKNSDSVFIKYSINKNKTKLDTIENLNLNMVYNNNLINNKTKKDAFFSDYNIKIREDKKKFFQKNSNSYVSLTKKTDEVFSEDQKLRRFLDYINYFRRKKNRVTFSKLKRIYNGDRLLAKKVFRTGEKKWLNFMKGLNNPYTGVQSVKNSLNKQDLSTRNIRTVNRRLNSFNSSQIIKNLENFKFSVGFLNSNINVSEDFEDTVDIPQGTFLGRFFIINPFLVLIFLIYSFFELFFFGYILSFFFGNPLEVFYIIAKNPSVEYFYFFSNYSSLLFLCSSFLVWFFVISSFFLHIYSLLDEGHFKPLKFSWFFSSFYSFFLIFIWYYLLFSIFFDNLSLFFLLLNFFNISLSDSIFFFIYNIFFNFFSIISQIDYSDFFFKNCISLKINKPLEIFYIDLPFLDLRIPYVKDHVLTQYSKANFFFILLKIFYNFFDFKIGFDSNLSFYDYHDIYKRELMQDIRKYNFLRSRFNDIEQVGELFKRGYNGYNYRLDWQYVSKKIEPVDQTLSFDWRVYQPFGTKKYSNLIDPEINDSPIYFFDTKDFHSLIQTQEINSFFFKPSYKMSSYSKLSKFNLCDNKAIINNLFNYKYSNPLKFIEHNYSFFNTSLDQIFSTLLALEIEDQDGIKSDRIFYNFFPEISPLRQFGAFLAEEMLYSDSIFPMNFFIPYQNSKKILNNNDPYIYFRQFFDVKFLSEDTKTPPLPLSLNGCYYLDAKIQNWFNFTNLFWNQYYHFYYKRSFRSKGNGVIFKLSTEFINSRDLSIYNIFLGSGTLRKNRVGQYFRSYIPWITYKFRWLNYPVSTYKRFDFFRHTQHHRNKNFYFASLLKFYQVNFFRWQMQSQHFNWNVIQQRHFFLNLFFYKRNHLKFLSKLNYFLTNNKNINFINNNNVPNYVFSPILNFKDFKFFQYTTDARRFLGLQLPVVKNWKYSSYLRYLGPVLYRQDVDSLMGLFGPFEYRNQIFTSRMRKDALRFSIFYPIKPDNSFEKYFNMITEKGKENAFGLDTVTPRLFSRSWNKGQGWLKYIVPQDLLSQLDNKSLKKRTPNFHSLISYNFSGIGRLPILYRSFFQMLFFRNKVEDFKNLKIKFVKLQLSSFFDINYDLFENKQSLKYNSIFWNLFLKKFRYNTLVNNVEVSYKVDHNFSFFNHNYGFLTKYFYNNNDIILENQYKNFKAFKRFELYKNINNFELQNKNLIYSVNKQSPEYIKENFFLNLQLVNFIFTRLYRFFFYGIIYFCENYMFIIKTPQHEYTGSSWLDRVYYNIMKKEILTKKYVAFEDFRWYRFTDIFYLLQDGYKIYLPEEYRRIQYEKLLPFYYLVKFFAKKDEIFGYSSLQSLMLKEASRLTYWFLPSVEDFRIIGADWEILYLVISTIQYLYEDFYLFILQNFIPFSLKFFLQYSLNNQFMHIFPYVCANQFEYYVNLYFKDIVKFVKNSINFITSSTIYNIYKTLNTQDINHPLNIVMLQDPLKISISNNFFNFLDINDVILLEYDTRNYKSLIHNSITNFITKFVIDVSFTYIEIFSPNRYLPMMTEKILYGKKSVLFLDKYVNDRIFFIKNQPYLINDLLLFENDLVIKSKNVAYTSMFLNYHIKTNLKFLKTKSGLETFLKFSHIIKILMPKILLKEDWLKIIDTYSVDTSSFYNTLNKSITKNFYFETFFSNYLYGRFYQGSFRHHLHWFFYPIAYFNHFSKSLTYGEIFYDFFSLYFSTYNDIFFLFNNKINWINFREYINGKYNSKHHKYFYLMNFSNNNVFKSKANNFLLQCFLNNKILYKYNLKSTNNLFFYFLGQQNYLFYLNYYMNYPLFKKFSNFFNDFENLQSHFKNKSTDLDGGARYQGIPSRFVSLQNIFTYREYEKYKKQHHRQRFRSIMPYWIQNVYKFKRKKSEGDFNEFPSYKTLRRKQPVFEFLQRARKRNIDRYNKIIPKHFNQNLQFNDTTARKENPANVRYKGKTLWFVPYKYSKWYTHNPRLSFFVDPEILKLYKTNQIEEFKYIYIQSLFLLKRKIMYDVVNLKLLSHKQHLLYYYPLKFSDKFLVKNKQEMPINFLYLFYLKIFQIFFYFKSLMFLDNFLFYFNNILSYLFYNSNEFTFYNKLLKNTIFLKFFHRNDIIVEKTLYLSSKKLYTDIALSGRFVQDRYVYSYKGQLGAGAYFSNKVRAGVHSPAEGFIRQNKNFLPIIKNKFSHLKDRFPLFQRKPNYPINLILENNFESIDFFKILPRYWNSSNYINNNLNYDLYTGLDKDVNDSLYNEIYVMSYWKYKPFLVFSPKSPFDSQDSLGDHKRKGFKLHFYFSNLNNITKNIGNLNRQNFIRSFFFVLYNQGNIPEDFIFDNYFFSSSDFVKLPLTIKNFIYLNQFRNISLKNVKNQNKISKNFVLNYYNLIAKDITRPFPNKKLMFSSDENLKAAYRENFKIRWKETIFFRYYNFHDWKSFLHAKNMSDIFGHKRYKIDPMSDVPFDKENPFYNNDTSFFFNLFSYIFPLDILPIFIPHKDSLNLSNYYMFLSTAQVNKIDFSGLMVDYLPVTKYTSFFYKNFRILNNYAPLINYDFFFPSVNFLSLSKNLLNIFYRKYPFLGTEKLGYDSFLRTLTLIDSYSMNDYFLSPIISSSSFYYSKLIESQMFSAEKMSFFFWYGHNLFGKYFFNSDSNSIKFSEDADQPFRLSGWIFSDDEIDDEEIDLDDDEETMDDPTMMDFLFDVPSSIENPETLFFRFSFSPNKNLESTVHTLPLQKQFLISLMEKKNSNFMIKNKPYYTYPDYFLHNSLYVPFMQEKQNEDFDINNLPLKFARYFWLSNNYKPFIVFPFSRIRLDSFLTLGLDINQKNSLYSSNSLNNIDKFFLNEIIEEFFGTSIFIKSYLRPNMKIFYDFNGLKKRKNLSLFFLSNLEIVKQVSLSLNKNKDFYFLKPEFLSFISKNDINKRIKIISFNDDLNSFTSIIFLFLHFFKFTFSFIFIKVFIFFFDIFLYIIKFIFDLNFFFIIKYFLDLSFYDFYFNSNTSFLEFYNIYFKIFNLFKLKNLLFNSDYYIYVFFIFYLFLRFYQIKFYNYYSRQFTDNSQAPYYFYFSDQLKFIPSKYKISSKIKKEVYKELVKEVSSVSNHNKIKTSLFFTSWFVIDPEKNVNAYKTFLSPKKKDKLEKKERKEKELKIKLKKSGLYERENVKVKKLKSGRTFYFRRFFYETSDDKLPFLLYTPTFTEFYEQDDYFLYKNFPFYLKRSKSKLSVSDTLLKLKWYSDLNSFQLSNQIDYINHNSELYYKLKMPFMNNSNNNYFNYIHNLSKFNVNRSLWRIPKQNFILIPVNMKIPNTFEEFFLFVNKNSFNSKAFTYDSLNLINQKNFYYLKNIWSQLKFLSNYVPSNYLESRKVPDGLFTHYNKPFSFLENEQQNKDDNVSVFNENQKNFFSINKDLIKYKRKRKKRKFNYVFGFRKKVYNFLTNLSFWQAQNKNLFFNLHNYASKDTQKLFLKNNYRKKRIEEFFEYLKFRPFGLGSEWKIQRLGYFFFNEFLLFLVFIFLILIFSFLFLFIVFILIYFDFK